MQAGRRLEELVSEELDQLGVLHERIEPWSEDDLIGKTDFRIRSPTQRVFGIQITFQRKNTKKIRGFVEASLRRAEGCVRVYLEAIADRSQDIRRTARVVAQTIRDVVTRLRNFGPHNMLGVRVSRYPTFEKFDLEDAAGRGWFASLLRTIEREARVAAIAQKEAEAQAENAARIAEQPVHRIPRAPPSRVRLWPPGYECPGWSRGRHGEVPGKPPGMHVRQRPYPLRLP